MPTGYQHMVVDYYVAKLRKAKELRQAELKEIKTAQQALAYQQKIKAAVEKAFGPWPETVPLNLRVTGIKQFDGWHLEKLWFESRSGQCIALCARSCQSRQSSRSAGDLRTLDGRKSLSYLSGFCPATGKKWFYGTGL